MNYFAFELSMDEGINLHIVYSSDNEVIVISDKEGPPKRKWGCKTKVTRRVRGKSPQ